VLIFNQEAEQTGMEVLMVLLLLVKGKGKAIQICVR